MDFGGTTCAIAGSCFLNSENGPPILAVVETAQRKVAERLSRKTDRPDMISYITSQSEAGLKQGLTPGEIEMNSFVVIAAGSESVTTILAGVINKLLAHPD